MLSAPTRKVEVILRTSNLGVEVGGKTICQDFNLNIERGSRWAILGINGAGKTTLISTLAGIRAPETGSITLNDRPLGEFAPRERAMRIGLMVQDDHDEAETTVLDIALLGRLPYLEWWQMESAADEAIAIDALNAVGLKGMEVRRAATLSGGERRRLAIAALITQQAPLLMLDEPNSHLDLHQQIALLDLLCSLPDRTLVMSLHDVNLAARYCTHALLLFAGEGEGDGMGKGGACAGPIAEMLEPGVLSKLYRHPVTAHDTAAGRVFLPT